MATLYHIICPECGQHFEKMTGPTMMVSEEEEKTFPCPGCGHSFDPKDETFLENAQVMAFFD